MSERGFFVAFGTLEALVEDLKLDAVDQVRANAISIPGEAGRYGVRRIRFGVPVMARVGNECRYAWVVTGWQTQAGHTPLGNEDLPERTESAYQTIVAWLRLEGFAVRKGTYPLPEGLREMLATAECLRET